MSMYEYVCMYVCKHVSMYICVHVHVYVCVRACCEQACLRVSF
jgi:hypothetical protein